MSDARSLPSKKLSSSWAKRIGTFAMVGLIVAGTFASLDAEARRMGGSRSIGRQSSTVTQRQATPPAQPGQPMQQSGQAAQAQRGAQPTPAAAPNRSRWLGPIAGLAAGLGIAALLSHFGLGEAFAGAMANFLVIAAIAMLAIWLIRRFMNRKRDTATPAYAGGAPSLNAGGTGYTQEPRYNAPVQQIGSFGTQSAPSIATTAAVPVDFDSETFLRNAKVYFVRLQAAWDSGNMADIREFTTPEMFAEVKVDLDSRGSQANQTDVVQLNADLLGVEERSDEYFASVRFSGLIRETPGAAAEPFVEVWNLSKSTRSGEGWLLAGIQQVAEH
ncbi:MULTISPECIES: Tim44 domain-containing protein [Paraburkholderia]|uniref:Tim44 domain-containing protein n=1 Tax=Paraburkholderia TaxID=1822464 RepID=UPI00224F1AE3|nr:MULTISPECIES: TIM44-like domain-containing protein [Paraburkholderia]MCX4165618.1 TIM44-like domain-containing protein [Paraburkholderia megapolitana]MDN7161109.1 Tim44-like domain-containing protein [Paraburkholderia sp. CHISQ3]MDQ6498156.1 Tim44-like domain-containing protein [Paraburkholderia megapolitana]